MATVSSAERRVYPSFQLERRGGVKTLVLTHLLPQLDQPGVREQIVHEIQEEFDGKVTWGEDLMRLTLTAPGLPRIGV